MLREGCVWKGDRSLTVMATEQRTLVAITARSKGKLTHHRSVKL